MLVYNILMILFLALISLLICFGWLVSLFVSCYVSWLFVCSQSVGRSFCRSVDRLGCLYPILKCNVKFPVYMEVKIKISPCSFKQQTIKA